MVDVGYVENRLKEVGEVSLSSHARKRAELRGIDPGRIKETIREGEILGAKDNDNPNVEINYSETYLILISSEAGVLYYLPIYFQDDRALITTVLKLSESNMGLLEW